MSLLCGYKVGRVCMNLGEFVYVGDLCEFDASHQDDASLEYDRARTSSMQRGHHTV